MWDCVDVFAYAHQLHYGLIAVVCLGLWLRSLWTWNTLLAAKPYFQRMVVQATTHWKIIESLSVLCIRINLDCVPCSNCVDQWFCS